MSDSLTVVLGATGRTGRRVVEALQRDGHPVRAASRGGSGPDTVRFDWADPDTWAPTLARPAGHPERSPLVVAGDDADAKAQVAVLLDSLGYDTLDAGPLAEGWRFQRDTPAYGLPYMDPRFAGGSPDGGLGPGVPTTAAALREALAAAVRYRDA